MDNHKNSPASAASGLENILLQERTSQIGKNKPGRLIFDKGITATAKFYPSEDAKNISGAPVFAKPCPVLARFSSMTEGLPEPALGVKGLALKFFTNSGEWDLVCSSVPVFALQDGKRFPEYLKGLGNQEDTTAEWEFYNQNPEALHHLLMAKSGRSLPKSFSTMDAYGGNTYSFINDGGTKLWVKFHLKSGRSGEIISLDEAKIISQNTENYYEQGLLHEIQSGNAPQWTLYVQTMTEDEAKALAFNPFDATKVWPHAEFPLQKIGEIRLENTPENLSQNDKTVFSPANIAEGIGFSPDRLLLSRLAVYGDAQRRRLGTDYPEKTDFNAFEKAVKSLENTDADYSHYPPSDPYIQAGYFYTKALRTEAERQILVENIVDSMRKIQSADKADIINRQFCHFFRANVELGIRVATGLQISIDHGMMTHAVE